jgi:hypothetical protein
MVARRSGVLKTENGTKYRLKGGETLADAAHHAVVDRPELWRPMEVHLAAEGGADDIPTEGSVTEPLGAEERAAYEDLVEVLTSVVEELERRGYPAPDEEDREPGWFARYVFDALASALATNGDPVPAPADIPPPPKPAVRKKAASGGQE